MEIVVERIAKKETYTIGRLYLLADGDVKRKALSGKTAGDKRSFEHSFDLEKLSKDSYFCDTAGLPGDSIMALRWAALFQLAAIVLTAVELARTLRAGNGAMEVKA